MAKSRKIIDATQDIPFSEDDARKNAEATAQAEAYARSDAAYEQYHEDAEGEDTAPPPTAAEAIDMLAFSGNAERAQAAQDYHKTPRRYLGTPLPLIEDMARLWRSQTDPENRLALAQALWDSDIHEAKLAGAKLLTQARLRPDDAIWATLVSWTQTLDTWALADAVAGAAARRLTASPDRITDVALWLDAENLWTRRAAFLVTLPLTRARHPSAEETTLRDTVLTWCADLASDHDWFMQTAIADWLSALAKKDPETVRRWLAENGEDLRGFARKSLAAKL